MVVSSRRQSVALVCVVTLLVAGAGIANTVTAIAGDDTAIEATADAQEESTVSVQNLSAPDEVQLGTDFTVSADIVNRNDTQFVGQVSYRIAGNVIASELVQLSPDSVRTVQFNISGDNTTGLPTGTFTHGVFVDDAQATANLTLVAAEETPAPEEEETPAPEETPTPEEEETPAPEEEETPEAETPAVTFDNQTSNGTVVTIESVTVPEGGFVVIHDASIVEGEAIESMLGTSEFLEAGTHENVTITLDEPLSESQQLFAVVYRDSNDNQEYDFVTSNRTEDGPYTVPDDELAINDNAFVTVENETES